MRRPRGPIKPLAVLPAPAYLARQASKRCQARARWPSPCELFLTAGQGFDAKPLGKGGYRPMS